MHAAIRQRKIKPGKLEDVTRAVREEALPRVSAMRGFKGFYFIVSEDGSITTLNLFEDAASAEASNQTMLPWSVSTLDRCSRGHRAAQLVRSSSAKRPEN